jgi:hypothetical protein
MLDDDEKSDGADDGQDLENESMQSDQDED